MNTNIKHTSGNQQNNIPYLEVPFDIIRCSWPLPVEQCDGRWPEWDTPLILLLPQPHWELIYGESCWIINWRNLVKFRRMILSVPDTDHGRIYLACWCWIQGQSASFGTVGFIAGLYWIQISMLRNFMPIKNFPAAYSALFLYTVRWIPSGMLGYDHALNPSRFTNIHFGGIAEKPSDAAMSFHTAHILDRYREHQPRYEIVATV